MTFARVVTLAVLGVVAVYLFATAPDPLPLQGTSVDAGKQIPIDRVFEAANIINHEARRIYTARIVGGGQRAGLEFTEDWRDKDRQAGPLPALFLRLVSSELAKRSELLSLFLGSDEPINPSNLFSGEQKVRFLQLKADGSPRFFTAPDGQYVAMYPDVASVRPCVTCHNEHTGSPKRDWKLGDIMGATTWISPAREVSAEEFQRVVATVYACVESAWRLYLEKAATFSHRPTVGSDWPRQGSRVLPDAETFMADVYQSSAPKVLRLFNDQTVTSSTARP